jgi:hypothetical protein
MASECIDVDYEEAHQTTMYWSSMHGGDVKCTAPTYDYFPAQRLCFD